MGVIEVTLFKHDWYHHMISQQLRCESDASPDALVNARAIMTAGAFIAEAIAHAFEEQSETETIQSTCRDLAAAAERMADAIECED